MLHGTGKACYSPAASFGIIIGALAVNYPVQHVAKLPVTTVELPSKKGHSAPKQPHTSHMAAAAATCQPGLAVAGAAAAFSTQCNGPCT